MSSLEPSDHFRIIDVSMPENAHWRERFECYRAYVVRRYATEHLIKNYTPSSLRVDDQLGVLVTVDTRTDCIVRFSTVFRPVHWPPEVVRVYNRTWIDPQYRASGLGKRLRLRSGLNTAQWSNGLPAHLAVARQHGAKVAVVSRQFESDGSNKAPALLRMLSDDQLSWHLDVQRVYLTCNHPENSSCWQLLIVCEMEKGFACCLDGIPSMPRQVFIDRFMPHDSALVGARSSRKSMARA